MGLEHNQHSAIAPQVRVNDVGSAQDFLAAADKAIKFFDDGDIVYGTIVKVDRDEVLLDIGYKTEGVIPLRELSIKREVDAHEVVKVGDHVEALVLQKEDKEGRLILSKERARYERAWGTIEKLKEEDGVVTGTVIDVVKGGLILDIGVRGFLPTDQVEMRRVRNLLPYVGRELEAKIIKLDKNRQNVVLSRRAWLEQGQSEVRSEFLAQLAKGQIRKGVVRSVVNFGAFVDLGGVDGLVHVSELSWTHINHPSEVVKVGQEVTVEILDVDLDRERVSLSLRATQPDPPGGANRAAEVRRTQTAAANAASATRQAAAELPAPQLDFFVSYTRADVAWAEWIAWQLEGAGYTVLFQKWDMVVGTHWMFTMQQGMIHAQRTIAVLSAAYLRSIYGEQEWQAAVREDPNGFERKLIPIRIEDCDRPGLLGGIVSFDLIGMDQDAALGELLRHIDTLRTGRAKPHTAPNFPGVATTPPGEPAFPGHPADPVA